MALVDKLIKFSHGLYATVLVNLPYMVKYSVGSPLLYASLSRIDIQTTVCIW